MRTNLNLFTFFPQREASGNVTFKIVPSSRNITQASEVSELIVKTTYGLVVSFT